MYSLPIAAFLVVSFFAASARAEPELICPEGRFAGHNFECRDLRENDQDTESRLCAVRAAREFGRLEISVVGKMGSLSPGMRFSFDEKTQVTSRDYGFRLKRRELLSEAELRIFYKGDAAGSDTFEVKRRTLAHPVEGETVMSSGPMYCRSY